MLPQVAIVGRPNVGKSTLFNRLVRARSALVDPTAGLTRDLRKRCVLVNNHKVEFIDSAGLDKKEKTDILSTQMTEQAIYAVEAADVVLFVLDGQTGLLPDDEMWAQLLRKKAKKILLVVNKCESQKTNANELEALRLGFADPIAISAEHNIGISTLLDALADALDLSAVPDEAEEEEEVEKENRPLRLAVIGRPNAGKSSLINRLVGVERQLTSAQAHTTRDAIDIDWEWEGNKIKLYDTAGLRRRSLIYQRLEKLSVSSALQAIRYSDVVILLLDAQKPFEVQDCRLAEQVIKEGRGLVLAVNKIDLKPDTSREEMERAAFHYLPQCRGVPVVCFSAKTGKDIEQLMPSVMAAHQGWNRKINTAALNAWLQACVGYRPPPTKRGRAVRIKYITQKGARPPTFIIFTTRTKKLPDDYKRYLLNDMRKNFDFQGTPVRLEVRTSKNPYAP